MQQNAVFYFGGIRGTAYNKVEEEISVKRMGGKKIRVIKNIDDDER